MTGLTLGCCLTSVSDSFNHTELCKCSIEIVASGGKSPHSSTIARCTNLRDEATCNQNTDRDVDL